MVYLIVDILVNNIDHSEHKLYVSYHHINIFYKNNPYVYYDFYHYSAAIKVYSSCNMMLIKIIKNNLKFPNFLQKMINRRESYI